MNTPLSVLEKMWDDRGKFSEQYTLALQEAISLRCAVDWLASVLKKLPPSVVDQVAYSTAQAWLSFGIELVNSGSARRLVLVDRRPYYNETRDLYYFCVDQGDDQLVREYSLRPADVPSAWTDRIVYNKEDRQKLYYDDVGHAKGWDAAESAISALNVSAFEWAVLKAEETRVSQRKESK